MKSHNLPAGRSFPVGGSYPQRLRPNERQCCPRRVEATKPFSTNGKINALTSYSSSMTPERHEPGLLLPTGPGRIGRWSPACSTTITPPIAASTRRTQRVVAITRQPAIRPPAVFDSGGALDCTSTLSTWMVRAAAPPGGTPRQRPVRATGGLSGWMAAVVGRRLTRQSGRGLAFVLRPIPSGAVRQPACVRYACRFLADGVLHTVPAPLRWVLRRPPCAPDDRRTPGLHVHRQQHQTNLPASPITPTYPDRTARADGRRPFRSALRISSPALPSTVSRSLASATGSTTTAVCDRHRRQGSMPCTLGTAGAAMELSASVATSASNVVTVTAP